MTNQETVGAEEVSAAVAVGEQLQTELIKSVDLEVKEPKLDKFGRAYATGRRKSSVARVWLRKGEGKVTVNKQPLEEYFPRRFWVNHVLQPLTVVSELQFDIVATVSGGGKTGQAGALRYGISRALLNYAPALRPLLRTAGFLTRDAREVERKKYGLKKARRRFQFSKR